MPGKILLDYCQEKIDYHTKYGDYTGTIQYWKNYLERRAAGEPLRKDACVEEWEIGFDIKQAEEQLAYCIKRHEENEVVVNTWKQEKAFLERLSNECGVEIT